MKQNKVKDAEIEHSKMNLLGETVLIKRTLIKKYPNIILAPSNSTPKAKDKKDDYNITNEIIQVGDKSNLTDKIKKHVILAINTQPYYLKVIEDKGTFFEYIIIHQDDILAVI